jgi:hypothetical protein
MHVTHSLASVSQRLVPQDESLSQVCLVHTPSEQVYDISVAT